jgi:hypothetical protein
MSTTITFRSDGAGLRSHCSPAAWTILLPASIASAIVRFLGVAILRVPIANAPAGFVQL